MMQSLRFVGLVLSLFLVSCASSTLPEGGVNAKLTAPYQLDSGDELRVTVFEQANLSTNYTVDQAGYVTIPLIGAVEARGRTTHQLSREIAERLKQGFVRNPDVSIEVQTFRPFFIHGEITNGGQYQYVNGLTVQTAIAIAGGYTTRANKKRFVIARQLNGKILYGEATPDTPVRPGDTITVKERLF